MRRSLAALGALILCGLVLVFSPAAQAEPMASPFGLPLAPGSSMASAPTRYAERSFLGDLWSHVLAQQQRINRALAAAIRQLRTGNVLDATLLLAFLSFTYGVCMRLGPATARR